MRTADFDYALPPERIAQRPMEPREAARLLVVGEAPADRHVGDLPGLLRPGDLMVVNDTRVLPTRFWGRRGDVPVEATLVEEATPASWWALCRPGKRLRLGDRLDLAPGLAAIVEAKDDEGRMRLGFDRSGAALYAAIEAAGAMPLPPYIARDAGGDPADRSAYQPPFARVDGSVAAPTASLHFTPALLAALAARGVEAAPITLHVGMGTFAPVKVDAVADHRMHEEAFTVPEATAAAWARARAEGRRVIAIGTTVLRALESAVGAAGGVRAGSGRTAIFITPGRPVTTADLLLTNFHLPRSTLLMLACAFGGTERVLAAYAHATATGYRFFSYGDACLIERHQD